MKAKNNILIFETVPFSDLTGVDEEGQEIPFDPGDDGEFSENLFTSLEVEILIRDLPPKAKKVFLLRREGCTNSEIAEKTNSNIRAVKQCFRRTKLKLRKKYGEKSL